MVGLFALDNLPTSLQSSIDKLVMLNKLNFLDLTPVNSSYCCQSAAIANIQKCKSVKSPMFVYFNLALWFQGVFCV